MVRVLDAADRRRLLVELTPEGHRAWAATIDDLDQVERRLMASMSAADQDRLADLLRVLMLRVDAQRAEVGDGGDRITA